jgi:hypothetical protein
MKKILLSAFTMLTFVGISQDFVYPEQQHQVVTVQNENYESFNISIETQVAQDIQYKWETVSNTFPTEWSMSLCDYGGCAVGIPPSGTMTAITTEEANNGTHGFLKLNLTVGQNYGQGKVEIYVYDANDYNVGDTVSWEITWLNTAHVNSLNAITETIVYPNPAVENLTIENSNEVIEKVELYTVNGSLIHTENVQSNVTSINILNYNKGVYFLFVHLKNGEVKQEKILFK